MDKKQQLETKFVDFIKGEEKVEVQKDDLPRPNTSLFEDLMRQRQGQRDKLYDLASRLAYISICFIIGIFVIQTFCKLLVDQDFVVFHKHELELIVTGVFIEIIAVVKIIANSLWDDSKYIRILRDDYKSKKD